jgi:putative pyruvate formate lyase activating enzyme
MDHALFKDPLQSGADLFRPYMACELCPRCCGVDRTHGQQGFCGETTALRLAAVEAHYGEEPPISGMNGSGTVFFSGCSLRCSYCQNYQISHGGLGREWSMEEIVERITELSAHPGIHNVNFVTPDHFFPHTMRIVRLLREKGLEIPVVYNLSGYQNVGSLREIEPWADVYLPDFKYSDPDLANGFSGARDYSSVALDALSEMIRQKGLLDSFTRGETSLARKGVLVRHMILPGEVRNSLDALTMLYLEFGKDLPLSLMSQYTPVGSAARGSGPDRTVTSAEFQTVLDHTMDLGYRNLFVQYPDDTKGLPEKPRPFVPDFRKHRPFFGNIRPVPR